ncbi:MAG: hypothetical protein WCJ17_00790 [bacterium]
MTTILIQKCSLVSILACLSIATIAAGDRAGGGSSGPAEGDCVSEEGDVESQRRWQIKPTGLHLALRLGYIRFVSNYLDAGDDIEARDKRWS